MADNGGARGAVRLPTSNVGSVGPHHLRVVIKVGVGAATTRQTAKEKRCLMGNAPSSTASVVSCGSAFGSSKTGALTTSTSQEELVQYAMAQEFLEQAKSHEEASQVSSRLSHTDSLEQLMGGDGGTESLEQQDQSLRRSSSRIS